MNRRARRAERARVVHAALLNPAELIGRNLGYVRLRRFNPDHPNEPSELILDDRLWVSDILAQDDRFEGRPRFSWGNNFASRADIHDLLRRYSRLPTEALVSAETDRIYEAIGDPIRRELYKYDIEEKHRALYAGSSIVSFFRNPLTQGFWDRYADGGRGYSLVFDFAIPWSFTTVRGAHAWQLVPFPVLYVEPDERPVITLSIGPVTPERAFQEISDALLTKSNDWAVQNEYRLVRVGIGAGHIRFPCESLRAVIMGYAIEPTDRDRLLEIVGRRRLPVSVYQARLSNAHFALDLVPVIVDR